MLLITCSKHFTKELTHDDLLWVNSQEEIILVTKMCCDGAIMISLKKKKKASKIEIQHRAVS